MQPLGHRSFSNGKVHVIKIYGIMDFILVLYEKEPTKYCVNLFLFLLLLFFFFVFALKTHFWKPGNQPEHQPSRNSLLELCRRFISLVLRLV